jgi:DNA recombination protein Rad52
MGLVVRRTDKSRGFSRDQLRKLVRDVDAKHLQTREFDGKRLTYIEGWYAIAQANAIFGHAGWDREMVHFERVMERTRSDAIVTCGYMARVRIRVRAGSTEIIREGTGWGSVAAATATAANERALKAAETDATKRALSTFGASFGLSPYDKDHVPIKPRPIFTLFAPDGKLIDDTLSPEAFCTGLRQLIEVCKGTHQVDQLSRHNRASLADLRIQVPTLRNAQGIHFEPVAVSMDLWARHHQI